VTAGARTVAGLVVYRFGSGLYFANAVRFADDIALLTRSGPPLTWFCLDGAAIGDVDYSAAAVLARVQTRLRAAGVRMVLANINESVAAQLERYGLTASARPRRLLRHGRRGARGVPEGDGRRRLTLHLSRPAPSGKQWFHQSAALDGPAEVRSREHHGHSGRAHRGSGLSSPAAAPTPRTSRCRARCTSRSCAVPSRTPGSRPSTSRRRVRRRVSSTS
jgi:anti-anti-sigma regulatory factor